ncbi:MAG: branched-chain amino acid transaminase [Humidesulfovibrio sp.]|jgi:branched-chain amino acid aminotransferase|uniref:branched-chain amino acid transaminase n=1 Tax=Humidesulfovibrio sp. TaxID=2910988 RepID=UPI00273417C5|nr:branched-chain amino acid transaminase [Humidesulfovibrio sp.]MDP2848150.1 branched-chain amino acid transaminase [Humidesulfovibrio sp.]
MVQKAEKIWFDGKLVPWDEANVHILTHTLHYGCGVFEGIRSYECTDGRSAVYRLTEHMQRLIDSAHILNMKIPFSRDVMVQAVIDTLVANKMKSGYIRPLVFIGDGVMGVHPGANPIRLAIATWPWGAYLGDDALIKGISVKTSSFCRHHVNAMMTKAKACGNYVNSVLAKTEAVADGYHEALMLDTQGYVSEASGENIFIIKNKVIKTTPLTSVLPGITRDSIMVLARKLGYEVQEQLFTRDELYVADEAFFSGTAAEITPIREVDRRVIGAGQAGPITQQVQKEYFRIVKGENPAFASWLHEYSF